MYCIQTEIPQEICEIDDELKAIYHSKDSVCIWVFKNREDRNRFMDESAGMLKDDRKKPFRNFLQLIHSLKSLSFLINGLNKCNLLLNTKTMILFNKYIMVIF